MTMFQVGAERPWLFHADAAIIRWLHIAIRHSAVAVEAG